MGLLDTGEAWLTDVLAVNEARTVLYTRAGTTRSLAAVAADAPEFVDRPGAPPARVEHGERWYQVRWADFAALGWGEPRVGDRVTETLAGTSRTFEVARRDGEPAWKWLDELRTAVQLHTKAVA